jgi:hypothetical protein
MYGLSFWFPTPENVEKGGRGGSLFDRLGIRFAVSTNMRKPWLVMDAVGPDGLVPYQDSWAILAGVHLEPQPWSAREGNPNDSDESWLEMNRWSCMPTIVTLCGWLFSDELMKLPLVNRYRSARQEDVCITAPASALDGPSTIDEYMLSVPDRFRECSEDDGLWTVDRFISDRLRIVESFVPPFPCRDCLRLNMASEGAPTKPMQPRPEKSRKGTRKTDAELEWEAYDAKIDKIVRVVEKACDFHDRRFKYPSGGHAIRRARRASWRKMVSLLEKARAAESRADALLRKYELSRMEAEKNKARSLYGEMASIMKGEKK